MAYKCVEYLRQVVVLLLIVIQLKTPQVRVPLEYRVHPKAVRGPLCCSGVHLLIWVLDRHWTVLQGA